MPSICWASRNYQISHSGACNDWGTLKSWVMPIEITLGQMKTIFHYQAHTLTSFMEHVLTCRPYSVGAENTIQATCLCCAAVSLIQHEETNRSPWVALLLRFLPPLVSIRNSRKKERNTLEEEVCNLCVTARHSFAYKLSIQPILSSFAAIGHTQRGLCLLLELKSGYFH